MRAAAVCLASTLLGCGTYAARPPDAALASGGGGDDAAAGDVPDLAASGPPADPPLGATPYPGGVRFRVWAPHAAHVFVAGDFNAWSATAHDLAPEASGGAASGGLFSVDLSGASAGPDDALRVIL